MPEELHPTQGSTPPAAEHPAEVHHPDGRIEHPSVHFEHSDARFKPILWILVGAFVFAIIIHGVIWWFFHSYGEYEADIKKSPYPLARVPSTALPPQPRLEPLDQPGEPYDPYLREVNKEEKLQRYGPLEQEEGFVHIPIEEAMKMLANKLPSRAEPSEKEARRANGLLDAGESNSGRMFRGKRPWSEP